MKNWYYLENGAQRGPVTELELRALFQVGTIGPETYLWCEGMPEWRKHSDLLAGGSWQSDRSGTAVPATVSGVSPASANAGETPAGTGGTPAPLAEPSAGGSIKTGATQACSQCGTEVLAGQIMRIGSASLCPKCQVGYRRQAQYGFDERPMEYAAPLVRLGAWILDGLFCSAGAAILLVAAWIFVPRFFPDNPKVLVATSVGAVVCVAIWFLDYYIGRIAREGATPAMKLFHIKIVTAEGSLPGGWRALARFLMIILTSCLTFNLGHLLVFFNKEHRSLHDFVCGTVVIKR